MTQSVKRRRWPFWHIALVVAAGSVVGATAGLMLTGSGYSPGRVLFVVAEALLVAVIVGILRWSRGPG